MALQLKSLEGVNTAIIDLSLVDDLVDFRLGGASPGMGSINVGWVEIQTVDGPAWASGTTVTIERVAERGFAAPLVVPITATAGPFLSIPFSLLGASAIRVRVSATGQASSTKAEVRAFGVFDPAFASAPETPEQVAALAITSSGAGQTITTAWTDVTFDLIQRLDGPYSFTAGAAPITIATAGDYYLNYFVALNNTLGSGTVESDGRLVVDTGAGFALVGGTIGLDQNHRAVGRNTVSGGALISFNAGDIVKLQAKYSVAAAQTVVLVDDAASILIRRIR